MVVFQNNLFKVISFNIINLCVVSFTHHYLPHLPLSPLSHHPTHNRLNRRLSSAVSMNRFRANIIVDGCGAFEEDNWVDLQVLFGGCFVVFTVF